MENPKLIMLVFVLSFTAIYLAGIDYFTLMSGYEVMSRVLIILPFSILTSVMLYYVVYMKN